MHQEAVDVGASTLPVDLTHVLGEPLDKWRITVLASLPIAVAMRRVNLASGSPYGMTVIEARLDEGAIVVTEEFGKTTDGLTFVKVPRVETLQDQKREGFLLYIWRAIGATAHREQEIRKAGPVYNPMAE